MSGSAYDVSCRLVRYPALRTYASNALTLSTLSLRFTQCSYSYTRVCLFFSIMGLRVYRVLHRGITSRNQMFRSELRGSSVIAFDVVTMCTLQ